MQSSIESLEGPVHEGGKGSTKSRIFILTGAALALAALFVALYFLPVKAYLVGFLEWSEGLGLWAPIVVGVVYILGCVFFLPGLVLTLGAGFLFGVVKGSITVSIASTIGACAAFLVGRTIARDWVEKKVASNPKFAAIDGAVGREGLKIVLLTRLSPVFPFNLLNYAFGLTKVRFWQYAVASWIGMIPGTIMYVYLGSAMEELVAAAAQRTEQSTAETVFFWAGLAIAVFVAAFVTRIARRALREAVPDAAAGPSEPGTQPARS